MELRSNLLELQQEIEHHKHHHSGEPDDHFVPTMEGFAANTTVTCVKLETLINQMKSQVGVVTFPCRSCDYHVILKFVYHYCSLSKHCLSLEKTLQRCPLTSSSAYSPPSSNLSL